jgi:hypothetical protein
MDDASLWKNHLPVRRMFLDNDRLGAGDDGYVTPQPVKTDTSTEILD